MRVMNTVRSRFGWSIAAVGLLLLAGGVRVFGRVPPQEKCADTKAKVTALAVYAEAQCHAKAALKGTAVDPACLLKAEAKLRASFAKADAKGPCPGDPDAVLSATSACVTSFSGAISGEARCAAKKLKAAGGKARDKAACARKAAAKGDAILPACLAKVETNFAKAILKADLKGACTGTAVDLEALVDACVATLPLPRTCSAAGFATCNGTCPQGLTCRPYEVFANGASLEAGCSCVDVASGPACGGTVCGTDQHCPDPNDVCERWTTGDPLGCDHMICQPKLVTPTTLPPAPESQNPCDGGEFPSCAGACPNGGRCQSLEAFLQGIALFGGCVCVDPTAPRCEMPTTCDLSIVPFSHCADPSLTCIVTLEGESGDTVTSCSDAHCGVSPPTTTSTSNTNSTSSSTSTSNSSTSSTSTSSSTTTSTSTSTTTSLPCTSTPATSGCFQDLGDCTIRDTCTGLQWEKKSTTPGPHHVDNRYVWAGCCEDLCQTMCQPNAAAAATCLALSGQTVGCAAQCPTGGCFVERAGAVTTVWDWINQLNAQSFAGHTDWRLATEKGFNPTGVDELESIQPHPCTAVPCIHPLFGSTASNGYWSATTVFDLDVDAWFVDFGSLSFGNLKKREPLYVRAVR